MLIISIKIRVHNAAIKEIELIISSFEYAFERALCKRGKLRAFKIFLTIILSACNGTNRLVSDPLTNHLNVIK